jgi:phage terminase small subunit
MPALTKAKRERFAQFVAEGKSGTDAYIEAGHKVSRKVAGVNASRWLKDPEIKARIEELASQRAAVEEKATEHALIVAADKLGISKERILDEIAGVAFATPEELKVWGSPSPKHLQAKLSALSSLGKQYGMFKDVHEHTGPDGGPIQIERIERVIVDPANPDAEGLPAPATKPAVQRG